MMGEWLSTNNLALMPIVLSVVAILAVIWLTIGRRSGKKLPPGLPALPVVGSIPFMGMTGTDNHLVYTELARKHGRVYSLWMASKFVVVLNGYDVIRSALVEQSQNYARRPYPALQGNPKLRGIIEGDYTPEWKKERMISLAILRDFGFGSSNLMETRIQEEVDSLVTRMRQTNGSASDLRQTITISVSNVISAITLGTRFADDDIQRMKPVLRAIDENFKLRSKTFPVNFFPLLSYLPSYRSLIKKYAANTSLVYGFMKTFISEHEAAHHAGKEDDFIDGFINRMGEEYKHENLLFIARDLFLAGTETAATTLQWALIYLANNPLIQKRMQDELDSVVGRGCHVRLEDKNRLPYTEAVCLETQRFASIVTIVTHMTGEHDSELRGHHIPANTMVVINLWSVLRDPELWPEPDIFRPERFIGDDGKVVHSSELIPFSLGRRRCLGEVMARQELFLFMCGIVQNFNIKAPHGIGKLDENGESFLTRAPLPFKIVAEPRM